MENGTEEDFSFEKMINFLIIKSKIVAPANNPRIALTLKPPQQQRNFEFYPTMN